MMMNNTADTRQLTAHPSRQDVVRSNSISFEISRFFAHLYSCFYPNFYDDGLGHKTNMKGAMICILLCSIGVITCEILPDFLENNPLISHWPDEDEIRNRMEGYAKEKFSQRYHYFKNISENETKKIPKREHIIKKRRSKRDGGIISGPVATAVVTGMIGMTAKVTPLILFVHFQAVTDIVNYHPSVSEGGCEWFGKNTLLIVIFRYGSVLQLPLPTRVRLHSTQQWKMRVLLVFWNMPSGSEFWGTVLNSFGFIFQKEILLQVNFSIKLSQRKIQERPT